MDDLCSLRKTYQTPYEQYAEHRGKSFKLLGIINPQTYDFEDTGLLYGIELETGEKIQAWPEEIFNNFSNIPDTPES